MQEPGGRDRFTKGQTSRGQDDNGPKEIIEVFLCEDPRAEEQDYGDDSYNAHVAKDAFELVCHAPKSDRNDSDNADEPLYASKAISHRSQRNDSSAFAGLEGYKEEKPD